ncbi:DegT/DnrJ/EryC1/StrS family aminotransferase, partial [Bacteriovoracaceae bacterium]|nr:DegT/DnrJ/EryC1/StrS family aminotransferase [Bacteriovoracaceae bacterium]
DIQASLALSQLKKADMGIKRRNTIAKRYLEELEEISSISLPYLPADIYHAFHLFVIQVENRKELYEYLNDKEIYAQVHYLPIYKHPYYQEYFGKDLELKNNEKYYKECLSIPMYPSMSDQEVTYVIDSIKNFFN